MAATGYTPWSVVVGEQPTTTKWNILGSNDDSFYSGNGINDNAILFRHLQTDMIPTGTIHAYAGSSAPSANWVICDGSAVSRTGYSNLYAIIGTTYGVGDGSTTFNLPDARNRVLVGLGADSHFSALGQTGGETDHTLTVSELASHTHSVNDPGHNHSVAHFGTSGSGYGLVDSGHSTSSGVGFTSSQGTGIYLSNNGSDASHNNVQPYITVNYIIKT